MLEVRGLQVLLNKRCVLRGVDFALAPGEVLAVIGANGSGKSSLLRALSGDLAPHRGNVCFEGRDMGSWPLEQRARQLAYLPQFSALNFPYTVREVIALGRIPHSAGRLRDDSIVAELMCLCDLGGFDNRLYTQLSGGEKRRVQLARALAQVWRADDSDSALRLLLLDEPAAALDLKHQFQLQNIVQALRRQSIGVIFVEHELNLALRMADRILGLRDGETVILGSPEQTAQRDVLRSLFDIEMQVLRHAEGGYPVVIQ